MAVRPLNIISLCTGGGGLDRAVELAIPAARPVLCVEREAFAVANLVTQMQQRVMASAPVWSDVRTVPGRRFRGLVDGVIGGIPCQPYSLAGKRLGRDDERDLWGSARRIFVQSGAWFILIENVGGMLSEGGAERVRRDLQRLGCTVEGGLFRASEVGASHERERLFILGVADAQFDRLQRGGARWRGADPSLPSDRDLADPEGQRGGTGFPQGRSIHDRACASGGRGKMALADGARWPPSGGGLAVDARSQPEPRGRDLVDLVDSSRVGWGEGQSEPEFWSRGRPAGGPDSAMAAADLAVLQRDDGAVDDAACLDRGLHARPRSEVGRAADARGTSQMVDAFGGDIDGRPDKSEWNPERRAAVEWAGRGPLFAPAPGDVGAWSTIAYVAPERLPALSRHDLFLVEIGKARAVAHGVAPPGWCKGWRDTPPEAWVDPHGPHGLCPAVVQAIAQSTLRRGSDGVAPRIDQLRMLGNGVVDLEGAYALRTLATDLARRSAGAAELVRMMEST